MKYELNKSPSREDMIEEFGGDPARLAVAEESIRAGAVKAAEFEHGKEHLSAGEVAHVLIACGLAEAFALFCTRLGGCRGRIDILPAWTEEPVRGILSVDAVFEDSGRLKSMTGRVYPVFPAEAEGCIDTLSLADANNPEWVAARRADLSKYERDTPANPTYQPPPLTVVRYPLSRAQAYRKFVSERWFDPGVPPVERFECPLDRDVFDRCKETPLERFNDKVAAYEGML